MIFTEEDKAFVKIFVPYYALWTTELWKNSLAKDDVWIGQPYHEAA